MTKTLIVAGLIALAPSAAFAQTSSPPDARAGQLATRTGGEISGTVLHYDYTEPLGAETDVKIHGPKFGGELAGTFALSRHRGWFMQMGARGSGGAATYDGSCRPWLLVPSSTSPNGYRLGLGSASPCSESGDADWYLEGRAVVAKDLIARTWALSPFAGIGVRHLSNGTTGHFNFRTDEYLYVPMGVTLRAAAAGDRRVEISVEYDHLLRGWQKTRDSLLGGGTVPATSTAPAFTIGDFTDLTFEQHHGWAFRAGAKYQLNRRWAIEPYYIRWRVGDSPVNTGSVAYTVNGITARQELGYYEPLNFTNEFGVKIGLRFGR